MAPRTTTRTSITGFGVWHPPTVLGNEELCAAFNEFVRRDNASHAEAIAAGTRAPLRESTPDWIVKGSGIVRRYVEESARPTSLINLEAGYTFSKRLKLGVDVFNLLNAQDSDIDYYYTSRLAGEPAGGVADIHLHPTLPRTARVNLIVGF